MLSSRRFRLALLLSPAAARAATEMGVGTCERGRREDRVWESDTVGRVEKVYVGAESCFVWLGFWREREDLWSGLGEGRWGSCEGKGK